MSSRSSQMSEATQHNAFAAQLAAKLPSRVTCVEAWRRSDVYEENRLLVGLQDGTLMILAPREDNGVATPRSSGDLRSGAPGTDGSKPSGGNWRVAQAFRSWAGNRSLSQLHVSPTRGLLLSLGDQGISVHRLPAFKLSCQASRTRGGKCFAWDDARAMLCVAVKRRIQLLHYDGSDFVELKEVAVAHSPTAMQWLGGNTVCIVFKSQYMLLDAETGEQTPLPAIGRETTAAMVALPGGEVMLSLDGQTQVFGKDGRAMKRVLHWGAPPAALAFSLPHVLAMLPSSIEVRSLRAVSDYKLLQTLPAPAHTVVSTSQGSDGSVFAASGAEVWQLRPTPLLDQAQELARKERYEEALDLCSLCSGDQQAAERQTLEDDLHIKLGHQLFAAAEYEQAMVQFGMCSSANPVVLLRLFPSLAPEELLSPVLHLFPDYKIGDTAEPEGEMYSRALNMLLPYLLSWRTRLARADAAEQSSSPVKARASPARTEGQAVPPSSPAAGAAAGAADSAARSPPAKGQAAAGQQQPHQAASPPPPPREQLDLQRLTASQRRHLAVLLDTALLKAMLALSDTGHLLRFVQRDNHVDPQAGRAALAAAGRYSELVALLRARGQHDAALELIQSLSQHPDSLPVPPAGAAKDLAGLPGVWAAVKYIHAMGPDELDLIRKHSRWILRGDSEAGVDMFVQMQPAMQPSAVLPIVQTEAPHLVVSYLEAALAAGTASHLRYDNELAVKYVELALSGQPADDRQPLSSSAALERLKKLLVDSEHIDADRLLRLVPAGQLLEVRALLLERFGRHQEILRIYVDELQNQALAEAYCDRIYAKAMAAKQGGSGSAEAAGLSGPGPNAKQPDSIYLQLIQVFLSPSLAVRGKGPEALAARHADMARILSRRHARIDVVHALTLIPDELQLAVILPFVTGALQGLGEQRRSVAIVRSLRRAGNLAARAELVQCKQRSVAVTEERACTICFKRIGTAAFVATQDGSLQHFSCCKRTSQLQLSAQPPPQTLEGGFPLLDARGAAHRTTSFGTVS